MLSILISVKNEAQHIEAALRSLGIVDSSDVEVIVVDDGSTDGTLEVVGRLQLPCVRVIRTSGLGKAACFSLAYGEAKGAQFILFAGDDLLAPEALAARTAFLLTTPREKPAVTFCKLRSFSEHRKYDGMTLPRHPDKGLESGGCIAFNRAFGDLAFPIPAELANEDSWLMLHVRFSGVLVHHVPVIGLHYRIHDNNSYKRGRPYPEINEQMWLRQRASFLFYEKYRHTLPHSQQRLLLLEFALQLLRYVGAPTSLMLLPGVSLKSRIKVLFNSTAPLYWIRERFYRFFSGR